MPLQSTSGAASYDAFGGGAAAKVNYIEDFFQSYLRTGTGASATVTTGLDGSTKETLVWTKSRSAATNHKLIDNVRGVTKALSSNTTGAEATDTQGLTAFSATGYTIGTNTDYNNSGATYVDWQWVAQPKFFDVVTYTGNETAGKTVNHSLGSDPGCIIIKRISPSGYNWFVYHRSNPTKYTNLNLTNAETNFTIVTSVSSTNFTLPADASTNANGIDYVAYLFAHNAGGFGLTGTDNVISCGSFTAGSNSAAGSATINLGYEPQWILTKNATGTSTASWQIYDNMRGCTAANPPSYPTSNALNPNNSNAESDSGQYSFNSTGFVSHGGYSNGDTIIYIAIRRGPMKVPTSGTSVFSPVARTGNGSATTLTSAGFPPDLYIAQERSLSSYFGANWFDRLRGASKDFWSAYTDREFTVANSVTGFDSMNGVVLGSDGGNTGVNYNGIQYANWNFRRAPSFFDEVCYTGTGVANTAFTHNLTVTPELMIVKPRSAATAPNWRVWSPINSTDFNLLQLSTDGAASSSLYSSSNVFPAIPTATTFTVGGSGSIQLNESGQTFVAYLFATCAGVSKCGTFTGNGSSQTINCGFTGGARFVLIKRVDSTGNWVTFDTARGIVSGNDPALYLNSTAAEVTGVDAIDPDSTGFIVNQESTFNLNVSSATYLVLAIA